MKPIYKPSNNYYNMIKSKITFCEHLHQKVGDPIWVFVAVEDLQNISMEKQAAISNLVAQFEKDIKQIVNPESND